jgi:hypothetical protein
MKRTFLYLFGFILLFGCGRKQPDIDRTYEEGAEIVLNHIEPYKIKGQTPYPTLKEETEIDLEKEEYGGLGRDDPLINFSCQESYLTKG